MDYAKKMINFVKKFITELYKLYIMSNESQNFYEVLDNVFDALFKKEGKISDDLLEYKSQLLDIYENEDKYKTKEIMKYLKPIHWYIDEKGCYQVVDIEKKVE